MLLVSVHAKARGVAFAARLLELSPPDEKHWCSFRLANLLFTADRLRESEDTIVQALALPTRQAVERAELLRLRAQVRHMNKHHSTGRRLRPLTSETVV